MNVLIDTPIWSLTFRRDQASLSRVQKASLQEFHELVREARTQIIGPIRQEVLSGVRSDMQFEQLRAKLRAFLDAPLEVADFEEAARARNVCQAKGIAGSPTDMLMCAVALRHGWSIFTEDADFGRYAKHLPIQLHQPRK